MLKKQSTGKLTNAPLKEVIFEIHWEGEKDEMKRTTDPEFDLVQGRFASLVKDVTPFHIRLGTAAEFDKPRHQYWKAENQWPVVQHGPGVLIVNEIEENYTWDSFLNQTVKKVIKRFHKAIEKPIRINKILLQYIDVENVDSNESFEFVKKSLKTELVYDYKVKGNPVAFNYSTLHEIDNHKYFELNIRNGVDEVTKKNVVLWTSSYLILGNQEFDQILDRVVEAHDYLSPFFRTMLSEEYYERIR